MPRRLLLLILGIFAACGVAGVLADRWARSRSPGEERAASVDEAGRLDGAEQTYWAQIERGPVTVPLLVSFFNAHELAVRLASGSFDADEDGDAEEEDEPKASPSPAPTALRLAFPPAVDEARIDALLARPDLAPDVALLGRFWRGVVRGTSAAEVLHQVTARADAEPPAPWSNHLLALYDMRHARLDESAGRFFREATHFPERRDDADRGFALWLELDAWDRIDAALADPAIAAVADPSLQLRTAIRCHDWLRAIRIFPRTLKSPATRGTLALAAIAALAWGVFCARLGHVRERSAFRLPMYLLAFILGVASVSMTLAILALEEGLLHMTEVTEGHDGVAFLRNGLYFVFGVGLREEVSKLFFFLPLLPILRRKGTRLDVLVCGALVGLGFAAEENLGYLHNGDLGTAMARFLTANFLHIAMTAIVAEAIGEWMEKTEGSLEFSQTLLFVAFLHGAYDFCLSSSAFGPMGGYLAMAAFFLLARKFLAAVSWARARERARDASLVETFAVAVAVVSGASFVYASALVGPQAAARAIASGLLGLGIILIVFVQELRRV